MFLLSYSLIGRFILQQTQRQPWASVLRQNRKMDQVREVGDVEIDVEATGVEVNEKKDVHSKARSADMPALQKPCRRPKLIKGRR